MTRVQVVIPPCDPVLRGRFLSEARANGHQTIPGTMDFDHGYPFDGINATGPLPIPFPNTLPTGLAPLRLWPLPVVLGLAALAGAVGGWLA